MIYLHAKFTWDKDLDVKATLADYYEKFYGPAKAEMREFFEYAQAVWMRPAAREITAQSGFLKPADVPKYFKGLPMAFVVTGMIALALDLLEREDENLEDYVATLLRRLSVFPGRFDLTYLDKPQVVYSAGAGSKFRVCLAQVIVCGAGKLAVVAQVAQPTIGERHHRIRIAVHVEISKVDFCHRSAVKFVEAELSCLFLKSRKSEIAPDPDCLANPPEIQPSIIVVIKKTSARRKVPCR